MRALQRAWQRITEPRHLKVTYAAFYVVAIAFGCLALFAPPQSISGELGPSLTIVWGILAIIGGTGGMLTVFPGWWFAERLSIVLIWLALGIYLLIVAILQATADSGSRWPQMMLFLFAGGLFYVRWHLIRAYSFEPRR